MLRSEFIQKAYLRATGKPTAPTSGSRKYNQLVELGKYFTDTWQNEPGTDWTSLFDFRNTGTVTATDTFALDATIRKVSQQEGDTIKIVHTDDSETYYELIPADRLNEYRYDYAVAVIGRNLVFSSPFTADSRQLGGTIVAPSYGYAEFPSTDGGSIEVDDPNWLVVMAAAEFVRNDITRQNQYPNLIAEANVLMQKMKENSGVGVDEIYRPNFFINSEAEW